MWWQLVTYGKLSGRPVDASRRMRYGQARRQARNTSYLVDIVCRYDPELVRALQSWRQSRG